MNASSAASSLQNSTTGDVFEGITRFEGSVASFLQEVSSYAGVITARSGLCELLALADSVPYAIVSLQPVSPFWRLGEGFGRAPVASLSVEGQPLSSVLGQLEMLLKGWG